MLFQEIKHPSNYIIVVWFSGILATLSEIDTTSSPISEAVNAAIAILENFSGIFLPGQAAELHPTIRLGLHIGM